MNIKEYISSGIVEAYVLGLASPDERLEFERLCEQYPELKEARDTFSQALEKEAMKNAISPSPAVKDVIWNELQLTGKKVIPIRRSRNWYPAVAAILLLLLGASVFWNISLLNRNKKLDNNYHGVLARLNDMDTDMHVMMQNPAIRMASLKGQDVSPQSLTTVYWDTTTHNVYLLVNNLPTPPSDKQYQLWAILDGKPIDLGMIDNRYFIDQKRLLLKAKHVMKAEAFAITLEDMGGHPEPKGDVYVKGAP